MKRYLLFILMPAIGFISKAQTLQADFNTYGGYACTGRPQVYYDASTTTSGSINSWLWNFGDGISSTSKDIAHTYSNTGTYNITLQVGNTLGQSASVTKTVTVTPGPVANFYVMALDSCAPTTRQFVFTNTSQNTNGVQRWNFGDGNGSTESFPTYTYAADGIYQVYFTTGGLIGCPSDTLVRLIQVPFNKPVLPTIGPLTLTATYECTDDNGWTNYFLDKNTPLNRSDDTLLISLKKNGNNIGTIGNGSFNVKVAATQGAGSNTGVLLTNPLITNASGFWVMNRYWEVTPTTQPTTPVGVRFYYNTQDLADVNGSYPTHNLNHQDLLFYKTIGGNPDPTTNLAGATQIISITNGTTPDVNKWVYTNLSYNRHSAEFKVASFSGGGGGATGNLQVLPVKLLSFNAVARGSDAVVIWTVANNGDAENYTIERSTNGIDFIAVKTITATILQPTFSWIDAGAVENKKLFYRLKVKEKNGDSSYSPIKTINGQTDRSLITISPNPAAAYLVVNTERSLNTPLQLVMFDGKGRKVFAKRIGTGSNEKILLPQLPSGYYHVNIVDNHQQLFTTNIFICQ
jgi:hypothetical protein